MDNNRQPEALDRLLEQAIKPNADTIAKITANGDVAVVVFEPSALAKRAAKELGWDKYTAPIFCLLRQHYPRVSASDRVTAAWLEKPRPDVARIFVLIHNGSLLVNFSSERGYWIEEGSTETELKPTRN